ncbi:MAG: pseudouridine synthase [Gammaproteobacteria bacterium]|jgi:23S rRNA pseudouridine2457 synthase|nr:pseudouridine synthase [Gammaproteobacteria bacterium]
MSQLLLFNKPFGVLSQFTGKSGQRTLAQYIDCKGFYAAGRLDKDSEGLLLLTDDGKLQQQIADPKFKTAKTYLAQVEGEITDTAIFQLSKGVELRDGITWPAAVRLVDAPQLWQRDPPIRKRKNIAASWIELTIREGRNRQVRRMTANLGFPTLRLVRISIGDWQLGSLEPGQWVSEEAFQADGS